jgi:hypothetical protein
MNLKFYDDMKSILPDSNTKYFILNYGLGDTINQLLYIESNIQHQYSIICAERNYKLIQFVLDTFIKESKFLIDILVYKTPIHGTSLNHYKFGPANLNINFLNPGVYCVYACPTDWNVYLDKKYIDNFNDYIIPSSIDSEQKVILFTERSDNYSIDCNFWQDIVDYCLENSIKVFHNKTTKKNKVYTNLISLNGCEEIDMDFYDLINFIKNNNNNIMLGQRSGIFDVLKFTNCKKIVFYPEHQPSLYECFFGNDIYAKNVYDIKLPLNKNQIKNLIV